MHNFCLIVKSYYNDLNRAKRLVKSIQQFNVDNLPLYLIVPQTDLDSFKKMLGTESLVFITDDEILEKTMALSKAQKIELPPVTMNSGD
jgi:hypothetical protein